MVLLHYLAFIIKRIFRLGQTFRSCLLGLLVCMSGHVFWLRVFYQFYSLFFFTLIHYKVNVVVVAVVCSFPARQPLLLLVTPRHAFRHASACTSLQPCSQGLLGFQNSVVARLAWLLAIHICSPRYFLT